MALPVLSITPLAVSAASTHLSDHVWRGPGWDLALHTLPDGGTRVARSRFEGGVRHLWHYTWVGGAWIALDHTVFRVDGERFVEAERYRTRNGPNLHPRPIALPDRLERDVAYTPFPGATVTLRYAGPVRLALGGARVEAEACCLEAGEGAQRGEQWLVHGIGEVALGPVGGPFVRWLTGWAGGGASCLGGIPEGVSDAVWPALPDAGVDHATAGLF